MFLYRILGWRLLWIFATNLCLTPTGVVPSLYQIRTWTCLCVYLVCTVYVPGTYRNWAGLWSDFYSVLNEYLSGTYTVHGTYRECTRYISGTYLSVLCIASCTVSNHIYILQQRIVLYHILSIHFIYFIIILCCIATVVSYITSSCIVL